MIIHTLDSLLELEGKSNHVTVNPVGRTVGVKIMSRWSTLCTLPWECLDWEVLGKEMVKGKRKERVKNIG